MLLYIVLLLTASLISFCLGAWSRSKCIISKSLMPPERCELCAAWTVCRSTGAGKISTNIRLTNDCIAVQKAIQKIKLSKCE